MAWKAYKKFETQQSVTEFTAEFKKEYMKAKKRRCKVSDTVLANTLLELEASKLSDTNEKFILTAVNFEKGYLSQSSSLTSTSNRLKLSVSSEFVSNNINTDEVAFKPVER